MTSNNRFEQQANIDTKESYSKDEVKIETVEMEVIDTPDYSYGRNQEQLDYEVSLRNKPSVSSFGTISVSGQSDIVAESQQDILNISAGTGISITTNPGTDTVTITSTSIQKSPICGTFNKTDNTTGNQSITGLGFTPKMVVFQATYTAGSTGAFSHGSATSSSNQSCGYTYGSAPYAGSYGSGVCINLYDNSLNALTAAFVSMDSDGFTINWTAAAIDGRVFWQAYP